MTKKDYIKFAELFKEFGQSVSQTTAKTDWDYFVSDFADLLKADNPNFDRKRFMEALADDN